MKILQASFTRPLLSDDLDELASISPQLVLVFGAVGLISHPDLLESLRRGFPDAQRDGLTAAVPMKRMGMPSSFWMAMATPPLPLPSSLVRMMPVRLAA
jgi:hypothetical protein